jgi:hypothetical protein
VIQDAQGLLMFMIKMNIDQAVEEQRSRTLYRFGIHHGLFVNSVTTPKAFANFSPTVGAERQPWVSKLKLIRNAESVHQLSNPFQGSKYI